MDQDRLRKRQAKYSKGCVIAWFKIMLTAFAFLMLVVIVVGMARIGGNRSHGANNKPTGQQTLPTASDHAIMNTKDSNATKPNSMRGDSHSKDIPEKSFNETSKSVPEMTSNNKN